MQSGVRQSTPERRTQTVLNVLSIVIALVAAVEALGIDKLFGYQGLSNDDADAHAKTEIIEMLFDPIGFVIMLTLLIAAIVIHAFSKRNYQFSNATTRASVIATAVLFVMGFFKVSMIFPMLFSSMGMMSATVQNEPDHREPTAQEFTLDPAELIQYQGAEGVRIATAVTNAGSDHWQSARVSVVYSDASGTACGQIGYDAEFLSPGERRVITTDFQAASIAYSNPSCSPVSATAAVTSIDIDSRAEIPASDYEQARDSAALIPVTSLAVAEQDSIGITYLAVTGSVDPAVVPDLMQKYGKTSLPLGFEVVDQQGLRLAWCFDSDEIAPDGSFATGRYHSPVDPGEFVSAAVVPRC